MNINLTIIGQSITFIVFVLICMKYVWPFITAAMLERQKKIADGLAAADRASKDLELAQEKATKTLREAKVEAAGILESANKRAAQVVDEAKEQARTEADRIKAAAQAEVEQEMNRAKEQLRSQVSVLAFAGAEKVLESSVDQAAHKDMIDKLAASL
ncbi:F0F1 ATP synthase subunit B [Gilvimarinus agarilyticus]|uniref:F0F1 ATP synthase subunit B n=1 Tax=unclassified Gilvimarinus TaxID=2642066 RepID=UPI001C097103|nr:MULTISPECIES: F0F1 ATP synthase subunit B [unclassified Gilvimarinus]MBU2884199.1 F0F1 ATP synthase subunit B [Gilvimarinus agarilyticus]MDO6569338.1 F0F1 ATP synthase subunit B [Gilvimarinus sp. 2_MG-2023]MDO6747492.1 F0F1 ATP synthase subunit B [Gilvimarinus sp. 1_MG-2023]